MNADDLANACHAALCEIGRPDLANLVEVFTNDDGSPYLEPMDAEDLPFADLVLMMKAESIALDTP